MWRAPPSGAVVNCSKLTVDSARLSASSGGLPMWAVTSYSWKLMTKSSSASVVSNRRQTLASHWTQAVRLPARAQLSLHCAASRPSKSCTPGAGKGSVSTAALTFYPLVSSSVNSSMLVPLRSYSDPASMLILVQSSPAVLVAESSAIQPSAQHILLLSQVVPASGFLNIIPSP